MLKLHVSNLIKVKVIYLINIINNNLLCILYIIYKLFFFIII